MIMKKKPLVSLLSLHLVLLWLLLLLETANFRIHAFSLASLGRFGKKPLQGSAATRAEASRPFSFVPPLLVHTPDAAAAATPQNHTASHHQTRNNGQQAESLSQRAVTAAPNTPTASTCILLNTNARSVTPAVVQVAKQVLGDANVFVTNTEQQAQEAAAQILQRNYRLVIPVGGDGTLSSLVNWLSAETIRRQAPQTSLEQAMASLPCMAYIPLGTGNGVGSVVGNFVKGTRWGIIPSRRRQRKELASTLQRLQAIGTQLAAITEKVPTTYDDDEFETIDVPMMEVTTYPVDQNNDNVDSSGSKNDNNNNNNNHHSQPSHGDLCFFAGVGFDSLMLNDFKRIKAWSIRTGVLTRMLSSVTGYCVALVVRTLPQTVWHGRHNIHVQVTTPHTNTTLWVDHRRGDVVRPVPNGLLYDGITGILAAGTSPFYGGGLRLFPFARLTVDQMHLRVGRIHPLTGFLNIPQIFAGTYRDKSDRLGCLDFIGDEFQVQVEPASNVVQDKKSKNGTDDDAEVKTKGYPFQHSGESVGHVEKFRLRVVKEPVRFICLKKQKKKDD